MVNKQKILIVDDEKGIVEMIQRYFQAQYDIFPAFSGQEALQKIACRPDLILLGINMPGMDGLDILRAIRQEKPELRVLILSARSTLSERVAGLDLGADDYLTKPFELEELEARVRALLRRDFSPRSAAVSAGALTLDAQRREITADGAALPLTRKEFELLEYLMLHPEQTVSQEELLDHIWESDSTPFSHSVRMHISSLRKKLRQALGYDPIVTKIGQGYRLEVER